MWLEILLVSQNMYFASAFSQTFVPHFFRLLLSKLRVYSFLGHVTDNFLGTELQLTPRYSTYYLRFYISLLCQPLLLAIKKLNFYS